MAGQFELKDGEYKKRVKKSKSGSPSVLSLKEVFPDYFQASNKVPALILKITREVLDKHCREQDCLYNLGELPALRLLYPDLPVHAANAKLNILKASLQNALDQKMNAQQGGEKKAPAEDVERKAGQADKSLTRIIHEGLPPNPSNSELTFWAERITQDIYSTPRGKPLPPSVFLAGNVPVIFHPIWSPQTSKVIGSRILWEGDTKAKTSAERHRRSLLLLIAAYIKGLYHVEAGGSASISIPVDASLFIDQKLAELYKLILSHVHPEVKNLFILELVGLKKGKLAPAVQTRMTALSHQVKKFLIECNMLSPHVPDLGGIRPMACGFWYNNLKLSPEEKEKLVSKFIAKISESKNKTYVFNVTSKSDLELLIANGLTYISGPAIVKPTKKCFDIATLALEI